MPAVASARRVSLCVPRTQKKKKKKNQKSNESGARFRALDRKLEKRVLSRSRRYRSSAWTGPTDASVGPIQHVVGRCADADVGPPRTCAYSFVENKKKKTLSLSLSLSLSMSTRRRWIRRRGAN